MDKQDLILKEIRSVSDRLIRMEEQYKTTKEKVDIHEERHEEAEKTLIKFKTERSNILTVAKVIAWVVGVFSGGAALFVLLYNFIYSH